MLVICSAVDRSSHTTKHLPRHKRLGSTVRASDASQQESETFLTLVGKRVCLQHRFSFVPQYQEKVLHFGNRNKGQSCFVGDDLEQTKKETKINTGTIGDGRVRTASAHRRQEQKKPTTEVVYQKKTKLKDRCFPIRQPLVLCTMNLPDKHLPCAGTSKTFSSTEEAKVMLKRLLVSTGHDCMTAESVSTGNFRQGKESQSGLLEKSKYLDDTYNYLFHRHVKTLNEVIRQQELLDDNGACGIYHQKNRRQVIQLSCGEGIDCDDAPITIGCSKSSSRHNTSTARYCSFSCDEANGSNIQESNQHINRNDMLVNPSSCNQNDDKVMNNHSEESESTNMNNNNQSGSCQYIQNNGDSSICLNTVTGKMNALTLREVGSTPKPTITFNHVTSVNESSSTYKESESNKLKQITTSVSSTFRSRSSSPLLQVPVPLEDLTTEKMRPPMN